MTWPRARSRASARRSSRARRLGRVQRSLFIVDPRLRWPALELAGLAALAFAAAVAFALAAAAALRGLSPTEVLRET